MNEIALVTTSYPDRIVESGQEAAGAFVADFAAALSRHVRVRVVAAAGEEHVEENGVLSVERFAVPGRPLSLLSATRPADWSKIAVSLRAGQRAVEAVVARGNTEHIFALWALPSGYWARAAARRHGVPYSTWALGSDIWSLGKVPVVRSVLRSVLRGATQRFADGLVLAEDVTRISSLPCAFLPSSRALDARPAPPRSEPPYRLAFLGRWHEHKGADLLIDALERLDDAGWSKIEEVRFCGGGPLQDLVRAGVERLRRAERPLTLGGYLDRGQASDLYTWADYLIIPSRIESIPVIFSDAVQCGVPLISTPVGDLGRLIESYGIGVLAERASGEALHRAIVGALDGSPTALTAGLERAREDFDVASAARRFYQTLVG